MKLLEATLASPPIARPIPTEQSPQGLCLDRGYDYHRVRALAVEQRLVPHIRTRGEEARGPARPPGGGGARGKAPRPGRAPPTMGRRGRPFLAEPQPRHPHPL